MGLEQRAFLLILSDWAKVKWSWINCPSHITNSKAKIQAGDNKDPSAQAPNYNKCHAYISLHKEWTHFLFRDTDDILGFVL